MVNRSVTRYGERAELSIRSFWVANGGIYKLRISEGLYKTRPQQKPFNAMRRVAHAVEFGAGREG